MDSSNAKRKIVQQWTIVTCSRKRMVAAKNVKVYVQAISNVAIFMGDDICNVLITFAFSFQNASTKVNDIRAELNGQTWTIRAPVTNVLPVLSLNLIFNVTHRVIIHCYQDLANAVQPVWVSDLAITLS